MIKQTRTILFARAKEDGRHALKHYAGSTPFGPEQPAYGTVEIVEQTTVRHFRNNKTRLPGKPDEVTERVVTTLTTGAVLHLINTLADSMADSLDTRGQHLYVSAITTEQQED